MWHNNNPSKSPSNEQWTMIHGIKFMKHFCSTFTTYLPNILNTHTTHIHDLMSVLWILGDARRYSVSLPRTLPYPTHSSLTLTCTGIYIEVSLNCYRCEKIRFDCCENFDRSSHTCLSSHWNLVTFFIARTLFISLFEFLHLQSKGRPLQSQNIK